MISFLAGVHVNYRLLHTSYYYLHFIPHYIFARLTAALMFALHWLETRNKKLPPCTCLHCI